MLSQFGDPQSGSLASGRPSWLYMRRSKRARISENRSALSTYNKYDTVLKLKTVSTDRYQLPKLTIMMKKKKIYIYIYFLLGKVVRWVTNWILPLGFRYFWSPVQHQTPHGASLI